MVPVHVSPVQSMSSSRLTPAGTKALRWKEERLCGEIRPDPRGLRMREVRAHEFRGGGLSLLCSQGTFMAVRWPAGWSLCRYHTGIKGRKKEEEEKKTYIKGRETGRETQIWKERLQREVNKPGAGGGGGLLRESGVTPAETNTEWDGRRRDKWIEEEGGRIVRHISGRQIYSASHSHSDWICLTLPDHFLLGCAASKAEWVHSFCPCNTFVFICTRVF